MSEQKRTFGWLKDPHDPRDYLHAPLPRIKAKIPDVVDRTQYLSPRKDQGSEGSCVGFGTTAQYEILARIIYPDIPDNILARNPFAARWNYNGAREIEGRMEEEGAYPRDAFQWCLDNGGLANFPGCLKEQYWPYRASNTVDMRCKASKCNEASHAKEWRIKSYLRVVDGLDGLLAAVAEGPVSIGVPWYRNWMNPKTDGILPKPDGDVVGGHEVCVFGYDVKKQLLMIVNSWGLYWGKQGLGFAPFSSVDQWKKDGGYDAHMVRVEWNGGPSPNPDEPYDPSLINFVRTYHRLTGQSWTQDKDNPDPMGADNPRYQWRYTPDYAGAHEIFSSTFLKNGKAYDGPVRSFTVDEATPPPPPPDETVPEGICESPAEGEHRKVGEEGTVTIFVRKKKDNSKKPNTNAFHYYSYASGSQ